MAHAPARLLGVRRRAAGPRAGPLRRRLRERLLLAVGVQADRGRDRGQRPGRRVRPQLLDQLHAVVVTTNLAARRLYARLGFRPYGIEPRALKVDDDYFDQELLVLCFERLPQFRPPAAALETTVSHAD